MAKELAVYDGHIMLLLLHKIGFKNFMELICWRDGMDGS